MKRLLSLLLMLLILLPALAEEEVSLFVPADPAATAAPAQAPASTEPPAQATEAPEPAENEANPARDQLIDRMIGLAKELYDGTRGRAQKAASAADIYVCKNFTVHLFRKNRDAFRMAEYPDVPLVIPNNLPAKDSKPYSYGIAWEDVPAEKGNPFYAAHSFYYDEKQSKQENVERARAFMREVKRGDFFQMSAQYYYGVGAHSLVFIADYNPTTGEVSWTDSNMKGESRDGVRYGFVQYEAKKPIDWFVDAFCKKGRGATLYRLRDDIIKK